MLWKLSAPDIQQFIYSLEERFLQTAKANEITLLDCYVDNEKWGLISDRHGIISKSLGSTLYLNLDTSHIYHPQIYRASKIDPTKFVTNLFSFKCCMPEVCFIQGDPQKADEL